MRFYYAQLPCIAVETRGGESFLAGVATLGRDTSITAVNIDLASVSVRRYLFLLKPSGDPSLPVEHVFGPAL
jgi:hypothetical protein